MFIYRRDRAWTAGKAVPLLCALLATGSAAYAGECNGFGPNGQLPVLVNSKLASQTTHLCNAEYVSLNSGFRHEPLWSAEQVSEVNIEGAEATGRVTRNFHADRRLPEGEGAELSDYRGSGYDRGHLSPSGAYVCQNNNAPTCVTISVGELIDSVGIDPFPGLANDVKTQAPDLPEPAVSPYRVRHRDTAYFPDDMGSPRGWREAALVGARAIGDIERRLEPAE